MQRNFKLKNIIYYFKLIIIIPILIYIYLHYDINGDFYKLISQQINKQKLDNIFINKNFTFFKNETDKLTDKKSFMNQTFKAFYISDFKNEKIHLINELYKNYIEKLIIDNELKDKSSSFIFRDPGFHEVFFLFKPGLLNTFAYMFSNISNLISIDFISLKTENLENMREMFKNCINLKYINFNEIYNLNNLIDISHIFENCISLTSLKFKIFESQKLKNISYMFKNCYSLKSINIHLNTTNVEDMSGLFYRCTSLKSIDLSTFKTPNVINFKYMFKDCISLTSINIKFFEIKKANNLNYIFSNCSKLNKVKLPKLNENILKGIDKMFSGCTKLSSSKIVINDYKKIKSNDICIVGLWYGCNYGSMLTYYALHEVVKNMGYSVLMIDNPLGKDDIFYYKTHPKTMMGSFYKISQKKNLDNLSDFNKECKCFLVGSDQLWNIHLSRNLKQFYFLGFVDDETKKLSYGTSFGRKYNGTEEEKKITKFNLQRFDGISVRDELSLNIIKKIFGINKVFKVCDPTFLLDYSSYIKLVNKSNIKKTEEYFLAYILDPNPEIGFRLEQLSIEKNIKIIILLDHIPKKKKQNIKKFAFSGRKNIEIKDIFYIEDWLWFFNNSKSVLTDSFHGTIFSIIFKKPFITLKNYRRGAERFISLLKPLNLIHRLFEKPDCINERYELLETLNYSLPIQKLSKIKINSYNWLKNMLDIILT